jgi:transcriptional regulator with XRE-family HTH domain
MLTDRRDSRVDRVVGHAISTARARAGLSQEALADLAHLHPTYVSQLERGLKSPTLRVFLAIARGLGLRAAALISVIEAELDAAKPGTRDGRRSSRT